VKGRGRRLYFLRLDLSRPSSPVVEEFREYSGVVGALAWRSKSVKG